MKDGVHSFIFSFLPGYPSPPPKYYFQHFKYDYLKSFIEILCPT